MLLCHGTTRKRAEAMMITGPNPNYREPNGCTAEGFSTTPALGPFDVGTPEDYARGKSTIYPEEGGPAVLRFELPDDVAEQIVGEVGELTSGKALNAGAEVRFEPGAGLEELLKIWPNLRKSLTLL